MPVTTKSNKTSALFGAGMAAQAVFDTNTCIDRHWDLPGVPTDFERIELLPGILSVVAREGDSGLSKKYHGVTPSDVVTNPAYQNALEEIKLFVRDPSIAEYGYFVPKFVPRPRNLTPTTLTDKNFKNKLSETNYFCMSVTGNLLRLQSLGYIKQTVKIGDDVIVKLGTVDARDISVQPIYKKNGTFFPSLYLEGSMIYFRPVYFDEVDLDFSKSFLSAETINPRHLIEKILCSIFLKFGRHLVTPRRWEIFSQHHLNDAYTLESSMLKPSGSAKATLETKHSELSNYVSSIYSTFKKSPPNYFNGIHLSYDRSILENVPSNIHVLDTSLSRGNGYHPTIEMYCKIRSLYDHK